MTSTRRGVRLRWTSADGVVLVSAMWTSTQKIRAQFPINYNDIILGPEDHRTSLFKESYVHFMSTACGRPQGEGMKLMRTHVTMGGGKKSRFSCGHHKWMTPM